MAETFKFKLTEDMPGVDPALAEVGPELKSFDLDVRIEGITRDQADSLLLTVKMVVESWGVTMAGGIVEVRDDEEA